MVSRWKYGVNDGLYRQARGNLSIRMTTHPIGYSKHSICLLGLCIDSRSSKGKIFIWPAPTLNARMETNACTHLHRSVERERGRWCKKFLHTSQENFSVCKISVLHCYLYVFQVRLYERDINRHTAPSFEMKGEIDQQWKRNKEKEIEPT